MLSHRFISVDLQMSYGKCYSFRTNELSMLNKFLLLVPASAVIDRIEMISYRSHLMGRVNKNVEPVPYQSRLYSASECLSDYNQQESILPRDLFNIVQDYYGDQRLIISSIPSNLRVKNTVSYVYIFFKNPILFSTQCHLLGVNFPHNKMLSLVADAFILPDVAQCDSITESNYHCRTIKESQHLLLETVTAYGYHIADVGRLEKIEVYHHDQVVGSFDQEWLLSQVADQNGVVSFKPVIASQCYSYFIKIDFSKRSKDLNKGLRWYSKISNLMAVTPTLPSVSAHYKHSDNVIFLSGQTVVMDTVANTTVKCDLFHHLSNILVKDESLTNPTIFLNRLVPLNISATNNLLLSSRLTLNDHLLLERHESNRRLHQMISFDEDYFSLYFLSRPAILSLKDTVLTTVQMAVPLQAGLQLSLIFDNMIDISKIKVALDIYKVVTIGV
jgi:hypothetical protein